MKEKIKLVIVFIIGIMISVVISVYAATVIGASEVSFNGTTSNIKYNGTTAANVSDAINGVYTSSNTLATNVTSLTTRVTNLEKHGCFTYTGTTDANGYLTVNHNKNISGSYYPVVNSSSASALVPYRVSVLNNNSFQVNLICVDGFSVSNPKNKSVTIFWCY